MIVNTQSCIACKQCIKCGHCIAICPTDSVSCEDESEYKMSDVIASREISISPQDLLDFMKLRRSVRSFKQTKIEEEKLWSIIESGRYSPTGRNAQDVSYVLIEKSLDDFRDKVLSTLHSLAQQYLASEDFPKELRMYPKMWLKIHQDFYEGREDRLFYHAPSVIIIKSKDIINGALALSRMELMINALGLGCFISGFCKRAIQASKELQGYLTLGEDEHIIATLVMGYPKVKYQRSASRKRAQLNRL